MSDGDCTRCGHGKQCHHKPTKRDPTNCYMTVGERTVTHTLGGHSWPSQELIPCDCLGYTVAVLPEGERLEFGRHRLPQDEAETALAWPPLS
jgi:hypothetical protein